MSSALVTKWSLRDSPCPCGANSLAKHKKSLLLNETLLGKDFLCVINTQSGDRSMKTELRSHNAEDCLSPQASRAMTFSSAADEEASGKLSNQ